MQIIGPKGPFQSEFPAATCPERTEGSQRNTPVILRRSFAALRTRRFREEIAEPPFRAGYLHFPTATNYSAEIKVLVVNVVVLVNVNVNVLVRNRSRARLRLRSRSGVNYYVYVILSQHFDGAISKRDGKYRYRGLKNDVLYQRYFAW